MRDSLPAGVTVGRPERRTATVDRMVRSFRVNLTALGLIALLVGTYFVYSTLSISVLRRRSDIGTVRALGASSRSVFLVFLAEGAALGVLGSLLGLVLGAGMAKAALAAVGGTATDFYLAQAAPSLALEPRALAIAFLAGLLTSILSALAPALEAAHVDPASTFRHGSVEASRRRAVKPLAIAGAFLLLLAALATRPGPVGGLPLFGFAAVFLVVAGVSLLAPFAVTTVARHADRLAVRLLGVEARIARANLTGSLSRTAVAVAALSMGISMMVAVAVMVGSFRATVVDWVSQTLKADLFVAPEGGRSQRALGRLPEEVVTLLERVPGVTSVDPFLSFEATRDGVPFTVGSGRFALVATHGDLPMADGSDTRDGPGARPLPGRGGRLRALRREVRRPHRRSGHPPRGRRPRHAPRRRRLPRLLERPRDGHDRPHPLPPPLPDGRRGQPGAAPRPRPIARGRAPPRPRRSPRAVSRSASRRTPRSATRPSPSSTGRSR